MRQSRTTVPCGDRHPSVSFIPNTRPGGTDALKRSACAPEKGAPEGADCGGFPRSRRRRPVVCFALARRDSRPEGRARISRQARLQPHRARSRVPDISVWEQALHGAEGAEAMKYDSVRPRPYWPWRRASRITRQFQTRLSQRSRSGTSARRGTHLLRIDYEWPELRHQQLVWRQWCLSKLADLSAIA